MKKTKYLILVLLILISSTSFAQQRKLDSLLIILRNNPEQNHMHLKLLNELSLTYANMQIDSGLVLADRAIVLAQKLNIPLQLAAAHNNKSFNLSRKGNNDNIFSQAIKALTIYQKLNDQNGIANSYINLAIYKMNTGDIKSSVTYLDSANSLYKLTGNINGLAEVSLNKGYVYRNNNDSLVSVLLLKAVKLFEKSGNQSGQALALLSYAASLRNTGNTKSYLFAMEQGTFLAESIKDKYAMYVAYGNQYVYYSFIANYTRAAKYLFKGIKLCDEVGDKLNGSNNYIALADLYYYSGNYEESIKYAMIGDSLSRLLSMPINVATALNYAGMAYIRKNEPEKAINVLREMRTIGLQLKSDYYIATAFCLIAECYSLKGDNSRALADYQKGLPIYIKINEKFAYAEALLGYSKTIYKSSAAELAANGIAPVNRMPLAIECLNKAFELGIEGHHGNLQRDVLYEMSNIYEKEGDTKNSFPVYKTYIALKDSILSNTNTNTMANLQLQYESEKQEQQIVLLNKDKALQITEIEKQKMTRNAFIGGFVLVLLLGGVTHNRYRLKQRANNLLTKTLNELKNTQDQLVKSEKMAAFGVMASRMAHEIQNPLNFVNNFSEFSQELLQDIIDSNDIKERKEIASSISENLIKINHHGNRAGSIVKQLQDHIRAGTAHEFFEGEKNI